MKKLVGCGAGLVCPIHIGYAFAPGGGAPPSAQLDINPDSLAFSDTDPIDTFTANGFTFSQGTSGFRPVFNTSVVNGHSVITFDSSNTQFLESDFTPVGPLTIFLVVKATTSSGTFPAIIGNENSGSHGGMELYVDPAVTKVAAYFSYAGWPDWVSNQADISDSGWHLIVVRNSNSGNLFEMDAVDLGQASGTNGLISSSTNTLSVGHTTELDAATYGTFGGQLARLIFYDTALSDSDKNSIRATLKAAYGTP